nr:PREDICTED: EF-hand domain-containing family member C2 isoform X2 [Latimeria chalumnae]|eukprot:XP_014347123.1 PREDICTED: EF-hand domain-containing family member C2 isoform X2 [Latimeria chalumnae]
MALPLLPGNSFNRNVLSFESYFQEAVQEKREEQYRIRCCKIYFYLEDDTIQVVEPEVTNSGIPQGTILRRHRVPLPPPNDDQFYTIEHFNIGKEVVFYSRKFMIINCDTFTRNFLRKMGVRLNPPVSIPDDPYGVLRKKMLEGMQPLRPYERFDTLKQFLNHDPEVLRFYCFWDDTASMFGDPRELILHYFLSDDTIEIREVIGPNAGKDAVPVFLHRNKLPKNGPIKLHKPGEVTARTVLNVFGPMGHGGRYILDSLKTGALHQEFYKDCDLRIGAVIDAWGRKIVLCDCDEFTKAYYKAKYGIEDFTPVRYKAPPPPKIEKQIPPYNGFGLEEDSLCSCLSLLPKPPQRDFKKFLEKDRQGLDSNVLRFLGKLITDIPVNKERKFIISYFLSDDTITVFEPPQRNSGVLGGKFLERNRIKKPGQEVFKSEPSEYYKAEDLFVGARVCFHEHWFLLVDADEYAFRYMEQHASEFCMADIGSILNKLKTIANSKSQEIKQFLVANDPGHTGMITYDLFRDLLVKVSDRKLSEHEIMTVGRYYSVRETPEMNINFLLVVAQEQLRKRGFDSFAKLSDAFVHEDRERSGFLPLLEAKIICKAFKIPLADDLLRTILARYEDGQGKVDYNKFITGLNWVDGPIPTFSTLQMPIQYESNWSGESTTPAVKNINYSALVEDIFGNQD